MLSLCPRETITNFDDISLPHCNFFIVFVEGSSQTFNYVKTYLNYNRGYELNDFT